MKISCTQAPSPNLGHAEGLWNNSPHLWLTFGIKNFPPFGIPLLTAPLRKGLWSPVSMPLWWLEETAGLTILDSGRNVQAHLHLPISISTPPLTSTLYKARATSLIKSEKSSTHAQVFTNSNLPQKLPRR
jgi:hypothetical protein